MTQLWPRSLGLCSACGRAEACWGAAQEFDASHNMLKANIQEFLLLSTAKRLELNNNALSGVLPPDFTTISGIVGALLCCGLACLCADVATAG